MKVLNETRAAEVFKNLEKQFTASGSANASLNAKRGAYFSRQCNLLNELYELPSNVSP